MPRKETRRAAKRAPLDYRAATINLTPELDDALDREAASMGVTRSAVVRLALQSWLADGSESVRSRIGSAAS